MKRSVLLILALSMTGCVAVPVGGPPGVYADVVVAPPLVARPYYARPYYYGYYGHAYGYRGNWRHGR